MIKGKTFPNQPVSAEDHGSVFMAMLSDGILRGCNITYSGRNITIGRGTFLISGRVVEVVEPETISVTGDNGYIRIKAKINTSMLSTETEFKQFSFVSENSDSNTFPALTQEDINGGDGTIYETEMVVATLSTDGVTGITRQMSHSNAMPDLSVTTTKLANGSVTTDKLSDSSVTSNKLGSGAVTTAKIADSNVTEAKLATDSVTADKIKAGAVGASELASNSVTTAKVADKNITRAKLADDALYSPVVRITANRNFALTDLGKTIQVDNSSVAFNMQITADLHSSFPVGGEIAVIWWNATSIKVGTASGVYLNHVDGGSSNGAQFNLTAKNAMVALKKVTSASWIITGNCEHA